MIDERDVLTFEKLNAIMESMRPRYELHVSPYVPERATNDDGDDVPVVFKLRDGPHVDTRTGKSLPVLLAHPETWKKIEDLT